MGLRIQGEEVDRSVKFLGEDGSWTDESKALVVSGRTEAAEILRAMLSNKEMMRNIDRVSFLHPDGKTEYSFCTGLRNDLNQRERRKKRRAALRKVKGILSKEELELLGLAES